MDKKVWVLAAVAVVAVVVVATATLMNSNLGDGREESGAWREVVSFSGVDGKTLPVFDVDSSVWRISYSWSGGESVWFNFFVYPEEETALYVEMVVGSSASGGDVTYLYEESGGYYVKVVAANLDSWRIVVEEYC